MDCYVEAGGCIDGEVLAKLVKKDEQLNLLLREPEAYHGSCAVISNE
jgi:hypothetical protein